MSDRRILAASAALAAVGVVSLGLASFADGTPPGAVTPPASTEATREVSATVAATASAATQAPVPAPATTSTTLVATTTANVDESGETQQIDCPPVYVVAMNGDVTLTSERLNVLLQFSRQQLASGKQERSICSATTTEASTSWVEIMRFSAAAFPERLCTILQELGSFTVWKIDSANEPVDHAPGTLGQPSGQVTPPPAAPTARVDMSADPDQGTGALPDSANEPAEIDCETGMPK